MSSEKICQVCKMAAVDGCPNTLEYPAGAAIARYDGEELVSSVCPNMKVVALRHRLTSIDPQLLGVRHVASTPLYQTGRFDRTEGNLFLTQVTWPTFLGHFKWAVASKPSSFFVRIVTDATLRSVYMGEASVKARLPSQREDSDLLIFNSLEDLLASPDLVVLRVGFVVYFNKALASILQEALLLRDGLGKPTWIVEPLGQEFRPWARSDYATSGMPCCNEAVAEFVRNHFEVLSLNAEDDVAPSYSECDGEVTVAGASFDSEFGTETEVSEPEPDPSPSPRPAKPRRAKARAQRKSERPPDDEEGELTEEDKVLAEITARRPKARR